MHPPVPPLVVLILVLVLSGCGKGGPASALPAASAAVAAADLPPLLLAAEDLRVVGLGRLASGALITGSLQPARRADLRAEVPGVVLQVTRDNGETVRAGELLVRLDDASIRDNVNAAEAALRAVQQSLDQASRLAQRQKTLQAQGMVSQQALEDAELRRNAAQSELVAARAQLVAVRQQLRRTEARAPFDGVVSERKVSVGDTAQVGKELLKVIDPRSMRFEGMVSAERMGEIRPGQAVRFRINGVADTEFGGKVLRVDAAANAVTRQVEVKVGFDDPAAAPRVAGLFAEGRIDTGAAKVTVLPESSVVRRGGRAFAWRVADGVLAQVAVELGERDPRSGEVAVLAGLAAGDRVLRNPMGDLADGRRVEFTAATAAAGASSVPTK